MGGIDQGHLLAAHNKGVVGGAVLEAKLDVKAIAIPVEGAYGCGVVSYPFDLNGEALLNGVWCSYNHG